MSEEKSEQQQPEQPRDDIECGVCGHVGGPRVGCPLCQGLDRFIQKRSYTLSEERRGLNPDANKERYGLTGDVNPKIVVLPGGRDPRQGQ